MHFNMEGGKLRSTPLPSYEKLILSDCPKSDAKRADMAKVPYCSTTIGSLMYVMICTMLDIAYVQWEWLVGTCQILARSLGK